MLKTWFLAGRPWSLTATVIPVTLGGTIAWQHGYFHPFLFILSLLGGTAIQLGTNYTNTYGDFISGVDTIVSNQTSPQLVRGQLEPKLMFKVGMGFFGFALLVGFYMMFFRSWPLLLIGALGIIGGYSYTLGVAYKYKGLGTFLVFFLMGPMMAWASYYVQTGFHSWIPVLASLPIGFLISGLLHANDFRDVEHDKEARIITLGTILGPKGCLLFYYILNISAYFTLILLVVFNILPSPALLPLLLIPRMWRQMLDAKAGWSGKLDKLVWLEKNHAGLHFQFGLLSISGVLINIIFFGVI